MELDSEAKDPLTSGGRFASKSTSNQYCSETDEFAKNLSRPSRYFATAYKQVVSSSTAKGVLFCHMGVHYHSTERPTKPWGLQAPKTLTRPAGLFSYICLCL
jgi:hypothetical protein